MSAGMHIKLYTLSMSTCICTPDCSIPAVLMLGETSTALPLRCQIALQYVSHSHTALLERHATPGIMGWAFINRGMLTGQTLYSVMDGTCQSRASPLDKKHFDECS